MKHDNINTEPPETKPEVSSTDSPQQNTASAPSIKGHPKVIRVILLLLFILSFFTLYFSLWLVGINTSDTKPMAENMWLLFLLLPLPLASLILGIIYRKKGFKAKKNIVVGIIFTALLVLYGSFTFVPDGMYSHDYSYVSQIETKINFDLPDNGEISIQDWTIGRQDPNPVQYYYMSDIKFTDKNEIANFSTEISQSNLWLTYVNTTLIGLVPSMYSYLLSSTQYDYFMIYNVDLGSYNMMPESSSTYHYIFLAYSSLDGTMKICEYSLDVLV